jgi:hypothetical protein
MKLLRRQVQHLAAAAAGYPTVARIVRAQTYTMRPVRIMWVMLPATRR